MDANREPTGGRLSTGRGAVAGRGPGRAGGMGHGPGGRMVPTRFMSGCISPERNWLFQALSYRASFSRSKSRTARSDRSNAWMTTWPEKSSSTLPFTMPS